MKQNEPLQAFAVNPYFYKVRRVAGNYLSDFGF